MYKGIILSHEKAGFPREMSRVKKEMSQERQNLEEQQS